MHVRLSTPFPTGFGRPKVYLRHLASYKSQGVRDRDRNPRPRRARPELQLELRALRGSSRPFKGVEGDRKERRLVVPGTVRGVCACLNFCQLE